jgi:hypothetical protein
MTNKTNNKSEDSTLKLKVTEALSKDVGRAYARMGPEDLEKLQVAIGDIIEVVGKRKTVCKAMPAYKELPADRPNMSSLPPSPLPLPTGISNTSAVCWTACRS